MNGNRACMVLSDNVKIEMIHSIKEVLICLIDALFSHNNYAEGE